MMIGWATSTMRVGPLRTWQVLPSRFGASRPTTLPPTLSSRLSHLPDRDCFWRGEVPLTNRFGQVTIAKIKPTLPSDAAEIHRWYYQANPNQSVYEDRKWHDWWVSKIRHGDPTLKLFKLSVPEGRHEKILGVIGMEMNVHSYFSKQPITLLRGIRVAPDQHTPYKTMNAFKGIGTALITFALAEGWRHNTEGIGLNSSVGVEGYYTKLLGASPCKSFDGVRDYFELTSPSREPFIQRQYEAYQQLLKS